MNMVEEYRRCRSCGKQDEFCRCEAPEYTATLFKTNIPFWRREEAIAAGATVLTPLFGWDYKARFPTRELAERFRAKG